VESKELATRVNPKMLRYFYRRLGLWFAVEYLLYFRLLHLVHGSLSDESVLGAILVTTMVVAFVVISLALGYFGFRTAAALGSPLAWLWGIAMLVPFVNLIPLLLLTLLRWRAGQPPSGD
jgi:hypothetical protein